MEAATSAMERVRLTDSPPPEPMSFPHDDNNPDTPSHLQTEQAIDNPFIPSLPPPDEDAINTAAARIPINLQGETPTGFFAPFVIKTQAFFQAFCHLMGTFFLRLLSTLMFFLAIIAAVALELFAFYSTGTLNPWLFISCFLYSPSLIALATIREQLIARAALPLSIPINHHMSYIVAMSYLVIFLSFFFSLALPALLYWDRRINAPSVWASIAATAVFYYCMLLSEVLFAASANLERAKRFDDEERDISSADPTWITNYHTIQSTGRSRYAPI